MPEFRTPAKIFRKLNKIAVPVPPRLPIEATARLLGGSGCGPRPVRRCGKIIRKRTSIRSVRKESSMAKPPKATPHSDIDGVHRDEVRNTDRAAEIGDSAEELVRAKEESIARPESHDDQPNREDRSR